MKKAHLKADKNSGGMKVHAETASDLARDFASPEFHATLTQALTCEKGEISANVEPAPNLLILST